MKQFMKYLLVGIGATGVEYATYLVVLRLARSPYAGVAAGFVTSVFFSYTINSLFVFRVNECETRSFWLSLVKTYAMYFGTGILLKELLTYLFIVRLGISELAAPLMIVVIVFPVNFIVSKLWAYRTTREQSEHVQDIQM